MMRLRAAVPLLVLFAFPVALIAQRTVYRNRDFGIVLPIPHGLYLFRPHSMTGIDHGRQFFFKPTSVKDCGKGLCDRYIEVFGSYNSAENTKRLHDFLSDQCVGVANGPCQPAPEDLKVSGLRSEAARVDHANGKVEIIVVAQAGKPNPDFDASAPGFNYSISLKSSARNLDEDLRMFRMILKTIRLSPPE